MTNPKSSAATAAANPDDSLPGGPPVARRSRLPTPTVRPALADGRERPEIDQFVGLIRQASERQIDGFVRAYLDRGHPPEAVYLDLLAPAARRLGALWVEDACDFVEVTVSVGRLQRVLRDLSHVFTLRSAQAEPAGRALFSSVAGEQHSLGLFMVVEFFVADGWTVEVGAPLEADQVSRRVAEEWFDLVGFSVACSSHLPTVRREVRDTRRASRNPHLKTIVGGRVFSDHPELVGRVGADGHAADAAGAPGMARALLSS